MTGSSCGKHRIPLLVLHQRGRKSPPTSSRTSAEHVHVDVISIGGHEAVAEQVLAIIEGEIRGGEVPRGERKGAHRVRDRWEDVCARREWWPGARRRCI